MSNESAFQTRRRCISLGMSLVGAATFAISAVANPARADFLDDVRRTFQKDIPRTFEEDIPRFFGAEPKKPPTPQKPNKPAKPPAVEHTK